MEGNFKRFVYLGAGVLLLAAVPLYFLYDPETPGVFPDCPFHALTGLYCPGCGSQRALHDLLHLDLSGALRHNILFIPAVALIGIHLFMKIRESHNEIPAKSPLQATYAPRIILIVVLAFTLLRNIPGVPMNYLAP